MAISSRRSGDQDVRTSIEIALYKHELESKLRLRERWFETTLRSIGDAVIATNAQGVITFMKPAQASAAPPLRRRTVEQRLRELVARMVEINAKSEFLVGIEEAYVYGSYLSAAERLGDLDISVSFYRKDPDRFVERAQRAAEETGRRFGSHLETLFWPETQATLYLKQRSRVFSIHDNEELLKEPSVPRQAIFAARRPTLREPDAARPPVPGARPDSAP
jgi:predicted nucleotidyltransferase